MFDLDTIEWIMTFNSVLWCGALVLFIFFVGTSVLAWNFWLLVLPTVALAIFSAVEIALGCLL